MATETALQKQCRIKVAVVQRCVRRAARGPRARGRAARVPVAHPSPPRAAPSPPPRRTQKELQRYHEELEAQKSKVARMRADNADEHDIKKQVRTRPARGGGPLARGHRARRHAPHAPPRGGSLKCPLCIPSPRPHAPVTPPAGGGAGRDRGHGARHDAPAREGCGGAAGVCGASRRAGWGDARLGGACAVADRLTRAEGGRTAIRRRTLRVRSPPAAQPPAPSSPYLPPCRPPTRGSWRAPPSWRRRARRWTARGQGAPARGRRRTGFDGGSVCVCAPSRPV